MIQTLPFSTKPTAMSAGICSSSMLSGFTLTIQLFTTSFNFQTLQLVNHWCFNGLKTEGDEPNTPNKQLNFLKNMPVV
jgi:hypothetical protein